MFSLAYFTKTNKQTLNNNKKPQQMQKTHPTPKTNQPTKKQTNKTPKKLEPSSILAAVFSKWQFGADAQHGNFSLDS